MAVQKKSVGRKVVEAGSWNLVRRISKSIPYVGTGMTLALFGYDIKKKGVIKGVANSTLDAIPIVGLIKNGLELVTGDFFPDKTTTPGDKHLIDIKK